MKKIIFATNNNHKIEEINDKINSILNDNNFDFKIKEKLKEINIVSLKEENINIDIEEDGDTFLENAKIKAKKIFELLKKPTIGEDSGIINLFQTFLLNKLGENKFYQIIENECLKYLKKFENEKEIDKSVNNNKKNNDNFEAIENKIIKFYKFALFDKKVSVLPGIFSKRFCFIDNTLLRNEILLNINNFFHKFYFEKYEEQFKNFLYQFLLNLDKSSLNLKKILEIIDNGNFLNLFDKLYGFSMFITSIYYVDQNRELYSNGYCFGYLDFPKGTHGFGYDPIFYIPSIGKTMAQLEKSEKNLISHRQEAIINFINKYLNN